jgi:hypothetical protein
MLNICGTEIDLCRIHAHRKGKVHKIMIKRTMETILKAWLVDGGIILKQIFENRLWCCKMAGRGTR